MDKLSKNLSILMLSLFVALAPSMVYGASDTEALIDFNGVKVILDADADTSFQADTDDVVDLEVAGEDVYEFANAALTLHDADESDFAVIFDGNAVDFSFGLDDSADAVSLSLSSVLGTTEVFNADGTTVTFTDLVVVTPLLTASAAITVTTGDATVTLGDVILTDGRVVGGVSATKTCSSGLVIDLDVEKETVLITAGETNTACAISFTNGTAGDLVILSHDYNGTGIITFADVTGWDGTWTPVVAECTGTDAAVTAASSDHFYISGVMTSATEIMITGCNYFDAA